MPNVTAVGEYSDLGCWNLKLLLIVAWLAARARQLCDPGQHPGWPQLPGLQAAHGGPSESVVSVEVGSSRPPVVQPGVAPGRAAAAGVASCTRRAFRVSRQWRGWQLAPASYATRDSSRAGRVCRCCQLHTVGHMSQSSLARLAACVRRQLCDPGYY